MTKKHRGRILAMVLCASVMAGVYASPAWAGSQSGLTVGNDTITAADTVTVNGVIIKENGVSAEKATIGGVEVADGKVAGITMSNLAGIRRAGTYDSNRSTYLEETVRVNNNEGLIVFKKEDGTSNVAAQISRDGSFTIFGEGNAALAKLTGEQFTFDEDVLIRNDGLARFGSYQSNNVRIENGELSVLDNGKLLAKLTNTGDAVFTVNNSQVKFSEFYESTNKKLSVLEQKTTGISYDEDTKTTTVTGNLNVTADTATSSGTSGEGATGNGSGNLGVGGNVNVGGNANIGGNLGVVGETWMNGDAHVEGDLGVTGKSWLNDTYVNGALGVTGNTSVGGNIEVAGNAWVAGDTHLKGALGVEGKSWFSDDVHVDKNLGVVGDTWLNGNATVKGAFSAGNEAFKVAQDGAVTNKVVDNNNVSSFTTTANNINIAVADTSEGATAATNISATAINDIVIDGKGNQTSVVTTAQGFVAQNNDNAVQVNKDAAALTAGDNNVTVTKDAVGIKAGYTKVDILDDRAVVTTSKGETTITGDDVVVKDATGNDIAMTDIGYVEDVDQELQEREAFGKTVVGAVNAEAQIRREEVARLDNRIDRVEDRLDKVGAMSAAIANLRTMGYDPEAPSEFAMSLGQYRSETGMALGFFHYPNRDFMLSMSVSTAGDEVMGGIGATWKFGRKKSAEEKAAIAQAKAEREAKIAKITAQQAKHAKMAGL